ncbi:Eco57I restriction-modification methylase domain-containing protein [Aequorivita ciconiae]|uniref:Eco57I restriction-modification methylase domain-containing protein n=1 Tax=Aequorivita ciconiae TaxID=2494375 RepID=UPI0013E29614|nr:N-6 DNA methylase [Aequorivita sp. H23M31]
MVGQINQTPYHYITIFEKEDAEVRNYVKRFMGRLVFLKFIEKKGWLGVPSDREDWKEGEYQFLDNAFTKAMDGGSAGQFVTQFLNPLFYDALNTQRPNDIWVQIDKKIPYLSGGLFEPDSNKQQQIDFPAPVLESLFNFFNQYNFTIDENDAHDKEVGIDPEMLGHIFENLLEDNKDKGAFYTPKEIVRYMCQESLKEYLKTYLEKQSLWPNNEAESNELEKTIASFVEKKETAKIAKFDKEIATALKEVKICDPAIGSGAFPMGLLNEIFTMTKNLHDESPDRVGAVWKMAGESWEPHTVKKNIIQNSIYGVDIEPGAVDIARLRFWLSLVIEDETPRPLPHLNYKIVVGDSLVPKLENTVININWKAKEEDQGFFTGPKTEQKLELLREITDLQKEAFDPNSDEEVIALQIRNKKIELLIIQLEIMIEKQNVTKAPKITDYQNRNKLQFQNDTKVYLETLSWLDHIKRLEHAKTLDEVPLRFFDWKLDFPEVLNEEIANAYGFDIVIGNPPYYQIQKMDEKDKLELEKEKFETFARTGDIYCVFYEKGFQLLKEKGTLIFITSNKWMKGGYGKVLRKYFTKVNTSKIINLGPNIFHSATVDTNIYVGKNEPFTNNVKGISIKKRKDILVLNEQEFIPIQDPNENAWIVSDEVDLIISKGFEKFGKPLKDWDLKIYRGVLTGFNEAFIIDQVKRDELVREDPKSEEIIRPILKGREIERYHAEWSNDFLINTHNGIKDINLKPISINDYPSIKNHLESKVLWDSVKRRQDQGDTPFNLRNCAYLNEFKKEKVIWKRIGSIMRFAYSDEEIYSLDSTCIATGEKIKYLTAILNSKPGLYQLLKTSPQTGTGDQIISVQALEPMFVHYPDAQTENKFNLLVDYILFIKKEKTSIIPRVSNEILSNLFESIVDMMAFELYFEKHMKEEKIDIMKFIDFPHLEGLSSPTGVKKIIAEQYINLNKNDNQIRNRILLSTTRSPHIIKRINEATV